MILSPEEQIDYDEALEDHYTEQNEVFKKLKVYYFGSGKKTKGNIVAKLLSSSGIVITSKTYPSTLMLGRHVETYSGYTVTPAGVFTRIVNVGLSYTQSRMIFYNYFKDLFQKLKVVHEFENDSEKGLFEFIRKDISMTSYKAYFNSRGDI